MKYAVDYSEEKQQIYEGYFGSGHYHQKDVRNIKGSEMPRITLAHASFPCTDTSVAGARGGIQVGESSSFWAFARILEEMGEAGGPGKPPFVLVENVEGLLTSGGGKDLAAILEALNQLGYGVDVLLINAACFVPQSRVRLFIVGDLFGASQDQLQQEIQLYRSSDARPQKIKDFIRAHAQIRWCVQDLPNLPRRSLDLVDIVDETAVWWTRERSDYLFNQMFERHKEIVRRMMQNDYWSYGTVFRRMRMRDGRKQSTAELRTDGIAGCLRTPKGGSARQIILRAGKGKFDARLINARECARLMGADDYHLPKDISLNNSTFAAT